MTETTDPNIEEKAKREIEGLLRQFIVDPMSADHATNIKKVEGRVREETDRFIANATHRLESGSQEIKDEAIRLMVDSAKDLEAKSQMISSKAVETLQAAIAQLEACGQSVQAEASAVIQNAKTHLDAAQNELINAKEAFETAKVTFQTSHEALVTSNQELLHSNEALISQTRTELEQMLSNDRADSRQMVSDVLQKHQSWMLIRIVLMSVIMLAVIITLHFLK